MIQYYKDCKKYLTKKEFRGNLRTFLVNLILSICGIVAICFGYYQAIIVFIAWIPFINFYDSLERLISIRKDSEKIFVKDGTTWEDYKLTID